MASKRNLAAKKLMKIDKEENAYFTTTELKDGSGEVELVVYYEYQPPEPATATYPGCDEYVTIDLIGARHAGDKRWNKFNGYTFLDAEGWKSEILELINENDLDSSS